MRIQIEFHMLRQLLLVGVILGISLVSAQDSPTILTIDGDKVTKDEFVSIYKKNNKDADVSKEALDEYVELFINFKLKVKEAERLNYDDSEDFKEELAGYRSQLARPYLVDQSMTEGLVQEAYERLKQEVKASHILIMVDADASPEDTLTAYKKLQSIKAEIDKGKISFENAAMRSSEDPSAKANKGMLGYFTSLQMVYPFESAAYNTPVGEISDIVRSQFGYHLVKVHDKRPARGEILAAHIMLSSKEDDPAPKQENAKRKMLDIYEELESGTPFEKLAMKHSDDKSSSRNGGELPWFSTNDMVIEFENEAFALENNGDYSKPFRSQYGWHIVKRLDMRGIESFEAKEKELRQRIKKDVRSQMSTMSFVSRIKREYGFKEKSKQLAAVHAVADSSLLAGHWRPSGTEKMTKWLFKIGKTKYTQSDFIKFLRGTQGRTRETSVRKLVDSKYELFKNKSLIDYEDSRLESKHPEFKALVKEYRDGILLFELTDEKVWSKAVKDTTGLQTYYEANKDDFMYDTRARGTLYKAQSRELAESAKGMVSEGVLDEEVEKRINVDSKLGITIMTKDYEAESQGPMSVIPFKEGLSEIYEVDGSFVFMDVDEILPPSHKPLDKVKGLVTAAYQTQLEAEWIEELRGRYTVELDRDVLYSVK